MTKVLIADDDLAILDSLSLGLEDEGFDVKTVADETVLDVIRAYKPDVILLDIWFGTLDGGEICEQIKFDEKLENITVILMSTGADTADIAIESGADNYLQKPIDMARLYQLIKS